MYENTLHVGTIRQLGKNTRNPAALGLSMFVAVDLSDVLVSVPSRLRIFWPMPLRLLYVFLGSFILIPAISLLPLVSL